MKATDPQFLYMVLILPTLFGLTLFGEGLNKILKDEKTGLDFRSFWHSFYLGSYFCLCFLL